MSMKQFLSLMDGMSEYTQLKAAIEAGRTPVSMTGAAAAHKTHIIASLRAQLDRSALVIVPDESTAIRFAADLSVLLGEPVQHFPARDFVLLDMDGASGEFEHQRLGVLSAVLRQECRVVVSSVESACERTIPVERLRSSILTIDQDECYEAEQIVKKLLAMGYQRREQVEGICQFAKRGGILDIFPPDRTEPVRIEFWDDSIDSMFTFQVDTQRRQDPVERVTIPPAREVLFDSAEQLADLLHQKVQEQKGKNGLKVKEHLERDIERLEGGLSPVSIDRYQPLLYAPETIFDYFDEQSLTFLCEPISCKENFANTMAQHHEDVRMLLEDGVLFRGCSTYYDDFTDLCRNLVRHTGILMDTFSRSLNEVVVRELISITASQLSAWSGEYAILKDDLEDYMKTGFCCVIFAGTHRGAQALVDDLNRDFSADLVQDVSQIIPRKIYVMEGTISAGMEYPQLKLAVISHTRTGSSKAKPARQKKGGGIKNISDLNVGDYVVHVSHGIGIFEGIVKRDIHGVVKDYIQIRYAGSDMLFVPVTQLDLVTKYIGGKEDSIVKLNKLNSAEWAKTRARVKKAVKDMADELIKLYAQRAAAKGYAFSQDTDWQNDFERRFPYDETDDQLRCIQEIKEDMEKPTPMDRLLCGDVGFGKTEVAIRAAFKCVMDSKQCAVLVPTTILAWQHYQTFRKRMEGFPIKVDILSRFRTPREQEQVLEELRRGEIDVLVGTHRLVQKDVRFKDLGLCIIDEEQRFGVKHKETFKEMRNNVDVLTLSATPIPRTLNMAMSGIRDMSTIEEAPQDRQPVQTYVMEHDWGILTQAMNKELRRGGQVFYLHNRVDTIDRCAATIQQMIPDATVVVAHGKMSEEQLSKVWKRLIDHEIDILVCTTIIETGVDVSNCNTLIIEDADRLGLSQLYQIRGRVGRSSRRAFAYLTVTKGKALTDVATKRLEAIREFTTFGSGFRIAMRDLEIRGAGNILGAQQHGHMEAVGYEMYLKMLSDAVAVAKGEKPDAQATECLVDIRIGAHIPEDYIESLAQRIDIYKKIASVQNEEDAMDITDELIDRFGEPPEAVKGLIDVSLLRNMAAGLGIREISQRTDSLLFYPETVDMQAASRLAAGLKGRVMLNAGAKPYLAVKVAKGEKPIDTMRLALTVMAGQDVAEAVQKPQKKQPLRGLPPKPYRD